MPRRRPRQLDPNSPGGRQAAEELTDLIASVMNRIEDNARRPATVATAAASDSEAA